MEAPSGGCSSSVVLIWRVWTNLFASAETTRCESWFSLMPQPAPTNAQEWPKGLLYAFPPLPLIPHVFHRITTGHYNTLLIAPQWLGRCWFPKFLRLINGQPWPLLDRADLLSQAGRRIWHPKPATLQLWAWPLCSPSLGRQGFHANHKQSYRSLH